MAPTCWIDCQGAAPAEPIHGGGTIVWNDEGMAGPRTIHLDLSVEMLFLRLMSFCCAFIGAVLVAAGLVVAGIDRWGSMDYDHVGAVVTMLLVAGVVFLALTYVCGRGLVRARVRYDQSRRRVSAAD